MSVLDGLTGDAADDQLARDEAGATRVIVCAPPQHSRLFVSSLPPGNERGVEVVTFHDDCSALEGDVDEIEPDVVVLSPEARNYSNALVERLRRRPDFMVVVVGLVPPTGDWGAEMKASGAAGFLRTPVSSSTVDRFLASLPRWISEAAGERASPAFLYDLTPQAAAAMAAQGYQRGAYASWSPKGGAGKTTLACNLAVLLGVLCQRPTLLVDANMAGGHVWLHMGIKPQSNIYSLASRFHHSDELTPRDLKGQVTPYGQALDVLPGITRVEQAGSDALRADQGGRFVQALLKLARRQYDFVIVDMGSSPNITVHLTTLKESDRVLTVVTPDRTALVDTRNTIETLESALGFSREHFWLIVNMYSEESGLSRGEIPTWIELVEMGLIPLDPSGKVMRTTNTGVPFVMEHLSERNPAPDVAAVLEGFANVAMNIYPPLGPVWEDRHQRMRGRSGGGLKGLVKRLLETPI